MKNIGNVYTLENRLLYKIVFVIGNKIKILISCL